MWALSTCGEPDEIKQNTHPHKKHITAPFREQDMGGSMIIHTFGAYFGLAVSWMMTRPAKVTVLLVIAYVHAVVAAQPAAFRVPVASPLGYRSALSSLFYAFSLIFLDPFLDLSLSFSFCPQAGTKANDRNGSNRNSDMFAMIG